MSISSTASLVPALSIISAVLIACGNSAETGAKTLAVDAKEQTGFLSVQTRPAAEISVDGESLGSTPIVKHGFPVGEHVVAARNTEHNYEQQFTVTIEPGETTMLVKTLEAPDSSDYELQQLETPSFAEPVEGKMGQLSVQTKPWSLIHVNGTLIGKTPLVNYAIQAGEYDMVAESPDHKYRQEYKVTIEPGKTTIAVETFQPGAHPPKNASPPSD